MNSHHIWTPSIHALRSVAQPHDHQRVLPDAAIILSFAGPFFFSLQGRFFSFPNSVFSCRTVFFLLDRTVFFFLPTVFFFFSDRLFFFPDRLFFSDRFFFSGLSFFFPERLLFFPRLFSLDFFFFFSPFFFSGPFFFFWTVFFFLPDRLLPALGPPKISRVCPISAANFVSGGWPRFMGPREARRPPGFHTMSQGSRNARWVSHSLQGDLQTEKKERNLWRKKRELLGSSTLRPFLLPLPPLAPTKTQKKKHRK